MTRTLLALFLLLFATSALAADPAPTGTTEPACPKAQAEQQKATSDDPAERGTRAGATAPARVRSGATATRGTPRWHSMLPGMFR